MIARLQGLSVAESTPSGGVHEQAGHHLSGGDGPKLLRYDVNSRGILPLKDGNQGKGGTKEPNKGIGVHNTRGEEPAPVPITSVGEHEDGTSSRDNSWLPVLRLPPLRSAPNSPTERSDVKTAQVLTANGTKKTTVQQLVQANHGCITSKAQQQIVVETEKNHVGTSATTTSNPGMKMNRDVHVAAAGSLEASPPIQELSPSPMFNRQRKFVRFDLSEVGLYDPREDDISNRERSPQRSQKPGRQSRSFEQLLSGIDLGDEAVEEIGGGAPFSEYNPGGASSSSTGFTASHLVAKIHSAAAKNHTHDSPAGRTHDALFPSRVLNTNGSFFLPTGGNGEDLSLPVQRQRELSSFASLFASNSEALLLERDAEALVLERDDLPRDDLQRDGDQKDQQADTSQDLDLSSKVVAPFVDEVFGWSGRGASSHQESRTGGSRTEADARTRDQDQFFEAVRDKLVHQRTSEETKDGESHAMTTADPPCLGTEQTTTCPDEPLSPDTYSTRKKRIAKRECSKMKGSKRNMPSMPEHSPRTKLTDSWEVDAGSKGKQEAAASSGSTTDGSGASKASARATDILAEAKTMAAKATAAKATTASASSKGRSYGIAASTTPLKTPTRDKKPSPPLVIPSPGVDANNVVDRAVRCMRPTPTRASSPTSDFIGTGAPGSPSRRSVVDRAASSSTHLVVSCSASSPHERPINKGVGSSSASSPHNIRVGGSPGSPAMSPSATPPRTKSPQQHFTPPAHLLAGNLMVMQRGAACTPGLASGGRGFPATTSQMGQIPQLKAGGGATTSTSRQAGVQHLTLRGSSASSTSNKTNSCNSPIRGSNSPSMMSEGHSPASCISPFGERSPVAGSGFLPPMSSPTSGCDIGHAPVEQQHQYRKESSSTAPAAQPREREQSSASISPTNISQVGGAPKTISQHVEPRQGSLNVLQQQSISRKRGSVLPVQPRNHLGGPRGLIPPKYAGGDAARRTVSPAASPCPFPFGVFAPSGVEDDPLSDTSFRGFYTSAGPWTRKTDVPGSEQQHAEAHPFIMKPGGTSGGPTTPTTTFTTSKPSTAVIKAYQGGPPSSAPAASLNTTGGALLHFHGRATPETATTSSDDLPDDNINSLGVAGRAYPMVQGPGRGGGPRIIDTRRDDMREQPRVLPGFGSTSVSSRIKGRRASI
ncbi:unnamed protein product [Amoebophrya sp. A25]|nr:unnamed protein product [Amoebophrya sp. A25]|eukprot:GSA25T00016301001.1